MLHRNGALGREFLDLGRAVFLPVLDVRVHADAQGSTGEDDSPHVVIEAGCLDGFLVGLWRTGFFRQNKSGADPNSTRPQHQCRCETLAVEEPARRDDLHLIPRHRALLPFDHLGHRRDENRSGHVTGVSASLAALGADHIDAHIEAFLHVLRVPDHIHVEDAGFVQALDDVDWGHADGGDEELGARVDDYGDEFVEFPLCVVVAGVVLASATSFVDVGVEQCSERKGWASVLCLPRTATHLRDQKIYTKRCTLVFQESF